MLNVACFVQSRLTDADFVIFSNYCLIGTRRTDGCSFFAPIYCFTHSSEEEMPMLSSSDSRALSSLHVMVPPLRA